MVWRTEPSTGDRFASVPDVTEDAIVVEGLQKSYGDVQALRGVDFACPPGPCWACSAPTGPARRPPCASSRRCSPPDGGSARVAGLDVVRDAAALRAQIGLAGQYAAVDENLTGRENLVMVGRLYHLGRKPSRASAPTSCSSSSTSPTPPSGRRRRTRAACGGASTWPRRWSPGRRCSSSTSPPPASTRAAACRCGRRSRIASPAGTTVLLTTQYLDEADRLADPIAVIDHGR